MQLDTGGDSASSPPKLRDVTQAAQLAKDMIALEQAAQTQQKTLKDGEWSGVTSYDWRQVPPPVLAKLYSQLPLGKAGSYLPMAQCFALAMEYFETGKNPLKGHVYILPSGRLGTSLEGLLIELKNKGVKIGKPKYERAGKPWPKGLELRRFEDRREIPFTMEQMPGMTCTVSIDDEDCTYTCWLDEWFMPGNPNWWNRMDWMLRVRAFMNCLKLGSGIGISEEIADEATVPKEIVTPAPVKPPSRIPGGFNR
jgi:hypothetical protein